VCHPDLLLRGQTLRTGAIPQGWLDRVIILGSWKQKNRVTSMNILPSSAWLPLSGAVVSWLWCPLRVSGGGGAVSTGVYRRRFS
jgi:hypothetical protein